MRLSSDDPLASFRLPLSSELFCHFLIALREGVLSKPEHNKKGANAPAVVLSMYPTQGRPDTNGHTLFARGSKQQFSKSNSQNPAIHKVAIVLPSSYTRAARRQLTQVLLLALCVAAVSGCGGLNYNNQGTAAGVALSAISCGTQSLTGPQTKSCSISLSSSALASTTVKLSSSNSSLKVPADVKIAVGQSSATFDVVSAGVDKAAAVTITASLRGITKSAALTLYPAGTGSGSGSPPPSQHKVQLSWSPPGGSTAIVAGYNIYRATAGLSSYGLLNATLDTATSYVDASVQSGTTYNYVVKSVDIKGSESSPSNSTQVTIP